MCAWHDISSAISSMAQWCNASSSGHRALLYVKAHSARPDIFMCRHSSAHSTFSHGNYSSVCLFWHHPRMAPFVCSQKPIRLHMFGLSWARHTFAMPMYCLIFCFVSQCARAHPGHVHHELFSNSKRILSNRLWIAFARVKRICCMKYWGLFWISRREALKDTMGDIKPVHRWECFWYRLHILQEKRVLACAFSPPNRIWTTVISYRERASWHNIPNERKPCCIRAKDMRFSSLGSLDFMRIFLVFYFFFFRCHNFSLSVDCNR